MHIFIHENTMAFYQETCSGPINILLREITWTHGNKNMHSKILIGSVIVDIEI